MYAPMVDRSDSAVVSTASACSSVSDLDGRPSRPVGQSHNCTTFRFTPSRFRVTARRAPHSRRVAGGGLTLRLPRNRT